MLLLLGQLWLCCPQPEYKTGRQVLPLPGRVGLWLPMGAKERGEGASQVGRERGPFPLEGTDAV